VFHVAGVNQMCVADPTEMFHVNVEGTRAVVAAAAAAGVRRIVFTSSAAVLGRPDGGVADEASPHDGTFLSAYARSKYEAEQAFFSATAEAGIEGVAVNPSSVQGPGRATGSARLLLYGLRHRFPVVIPAAVSIVDIADSSLGHLLAWRKGVAGERYVLSGSTIDIADAVRLLGEIAGNRRTPIVLPRWLVAAVGRPAVAIASRVSDSGFLCRETLDTLVAGSRYDGSKATRSLGLEYTPLAATLERTVRWLHDFGFVGRRLSRFRV
jgi:dihydroflavonol-4-reductase